MRRVLLTTVMLICVTVEPLAVWAEVPAAPPSGVESAARPAVIATQQTPASAASSASGSRSTSSGSGTGQNPSWPELNLLETLEGLALAFGVGLAVALVVLTGMGIRIIWEALDLGRAAAGATAPGNPISGAPIEDTSMASNRFTFRRHWGSFGGESTGWNLSPSLMKLLTGLAMVAAGVSMLAYGIAIMEPLAMRTADSNLTSPSKAPASAPGK